MNNSVAPAAPDRSSKKLHKMLWFNFKFQPKTESALEANSLAFFCISVETLKKLSYHGDWLDSKLELAEELSLCYSKQMNIIEADVQ